MQVGSWVLLHRQWCTITDSTVNLYVCNFYRICIYHTSAWRRRRERVPRCCRGPSRWSSIWLPPPTVSNLSPFFPRLSFASSWYPSLYIACNIVSSLFECPLFQKDVGRLFIAMLALQNLDAPCYSSIKLSLFPFSRRYSIRCTTNKIEARCSSLRERPSGRSPLADSCDFPLFLDRAAQGRSPQDASQFPGKRGHTGG